MDEIVLGSPVPGSDESEYPLMPCNHSKCQGGFIEGWEHHQTKGKIKHEFAPKLFCEESQGNVAGILLHPI